MSEMSKQSAAVLLAAISNLTGQSLDEMIDASEELHAALTPADEKEKTESE